ncbi:cyclase family protein [Donghicola sp. XS_ASV15]|uniref:cyclase family protein n=1 Tax=Donghicola sp. XS_ASV15 TaxID=3241295 RepID=UPI003514F4E4
MKLVDLSMPIETGHFRWPVTRRKAGDFEQGSLFEVTSIATTCHGFTHMDAPSHMVPGGDTLDELDLARVVGPAAVIDLSDIGPNEEITDQHLEAAASHLRSGEIALFRTCWDEQRDWRGESYWRDAPWLAASACKWLLARQPTAIAFDFPQDWTIRKILDDEMRPIEEHVSHDILLRNGITLIEYLVGTVSITDSRVYLCALPIHIPGADGAPARVVALCGEDASELR